MRQHLRTLRLWLHGFNPVAIWREERRLDREMKLEIIRDLCDTLREQSRVATKALDLSALFLKNFETQEAPESYVVREEDEVKAAMLRHGLDPETLSEDIDSYYN